MVLLIVRRPRLTSRGFFCIIQSAAIGSQLARVVSRFSVNTGCQNALCNSITAAPETDKEKAPTGKSGPFLNSGNHG